VHESQETYPLVTENCHKWLRDFVAVAFARGGPVDYGLFARQALQSFELQWVIPTMIRQVAKAGTKVAKKAAF
jgi:hypothetical protein